MSEVIDGKFYDNCESCKINNYQSCTNEKCEEFSNGCVLCQHCLEYQIPVEDLKPPTVIWIPQGGKDD